MIKSALTYHGDDNKNHKLTDEAPHICSNY